MHDPLPFRDGRNVAMQVLSPISRLHNSCGRLVPRNAVTLKCPRVNNTIKTAIVVQVDNLVFYLQNCAKERCNIKMSMSKQYN